MGLKYSPPFTILFLKSLKKFINSSELIPLWNTITDPFIIHFCHLIAHNQELFSALIDKENHLDTHTWEKPETEIHPNPNQEPTWEEKLNLTSHEQSYHIAQLLKHRNVSSYLCYFLANPQNLIGLEKSGVSKKDIALCQGFYNTTRAQYHLLYLLSHQFEKISQNLFCNKTMVHLALLRLESTQKLLMLLDNDFLEKKQHFSVMIILRKVLNSPEGLKCLLSHYSDSKLDSKQFHMDLQKLKELEFDFQQSYPGIKSGKKITRFDQTLVHYSSLNG